MPLRIRGQDDPRGVTVWRGEIDEELRRLFRLAEGNGFDPSPASGGRGPYGRLVGILLRIGALVSRLPRRPRSAHRDHEVSEFVCAVEAGAGTVVLVGTWTTTGWSANGAAASWTASTKATMTALMPGPPLSAT